MSGVVGPGDTIDYEFGSNWDGAIWFDITAGTTVANTNATEIVNIDGEGAQIAGDGAADTLTVAAAQIGGPFVFTGAIITTDFQLGGSGAEFPDPGLQISGGDLVATADLTVDQDETLTANGGGSIVGPTESTTPGVFDFGAIEINDGTVTVGLFELQGSLDISNGSGTFGTLVVGSYTGEGGAGGIGQLSLENGGKVDVTGPLVEDSQQGTGVANIAGGTLTVGGDADIGDDGSASLSLTADGSVTVTGSLDIGVETTASGTILVSGSGSSLTADAGVTVGDAGTGYVNVTAGASLDAGSDTFTLGNASGGIGTLAVSGNDAAVSLGGLTVGESGNGTLAISGEGQVSTSDDVTIGASSGGKGTVTISGEDSLLDDGGGLTVGGSGTGFLTINQGSIAVFDGAATLGESSGGSGSITLQSASLALSGSLSIGEAGSGSLEVDTDGNLQAGNIELGGSANANGAMTVSGTEAMARSSGLTVGDRGTGAVEISAQGSLDTTGQADLGESVSPGEQQVSVLGQAQWTIGSALDVGDAGNGSIAVGGGGQIFAGTVILGDNTNATGSVAVSGTIGLSGGGTQASALFYGGALTVGDSGAGTLTVSQGGVVGVAAHGTIVLGAETGGSGSISVSGANSLLYASVLAIGGSTSAAEGAGTITIGTGGSVIAGAVMVWSSGSISLAGGNLITDPMTIDGEVSGYGTIAGAITDNGIIAADGGTLTLSDAIGGGGALTFDGLATLVLGTPGSEINAPVTGLSAGDRIELAGLTIDGAQVSSPGTVTVATSTGSYLLTDVSFAGGSSQTFTTGHDPATGDDFFQVACFAAGTGIATRQGERAVETLRIGDQVRLACGGLTDVVWIGRRTIDATRHRSPPAVWPVRIAAGAFGERRPARDLFLSPDHAVFVDNVLIPVKYLIESRTIARFPVDTVTYFHIELPRHDVLLAEGLPVESYLDLGDRANFIHGNGPIRLHPGFSVMPREAVGFAPLIVTGRALETVRARLAAIDAKRSSRAAHAGRWLA